MKLNTYKHLPPSVHHLIHSTTCHNKFATRNILFSNTSKNNNTTLQAVRVPIGLYWHRRVFPGTRMRMRRRRSLCCRWMVWNYAILNRASCQCQDVSHLLYSVQMDVMFIRLVIFVKYKKILQRLTTKDHVQNSK